MKILLYIICLLFFARVSAQNGFSYQTSTHILPLVKTINISDPITDYDPKLLLIEALAPLPANESKQAKLKLDDQRLQYPKNRLPLTTSQYKTTIPVPSVLNSFSGNTTQGTPNDNDLAISNAGLIVSVVNSNLNIFNDTGKYISGKSLSSFASILGALNRAFDPRVIYDPIEDRFVLVFLQGSTSADTRIIVAFSQTNDPSQKWNFYTIPGNVTGDSSWSDYPILSLTKDELFITVNRVKDNTPWQTGFVTSYIWQCDKKAGYTGLPIAQKLYSDITYNGKSVWNICPVKGGSTLYGPNQFFVSQRPSDLQNDTVFLHEISNTNSSGKALLTQKVIRTNNSYGLQPNAIQPNGKKLQTNDARVLSAMYENGFIHYVGNTIDTTLFAPAVYYGIISGVFGNTPAIEGKVISYDSMDIGYPSISYIGKGQGDNSSLITFSHVSPTLFPGTSAVITDRFGNVSGPVFVKKGDNNISVINDSVNRWGDYTGNQRKYNELGVCWINGSYGTSNGGNKTWIGKLRSNDPLLSIKEDVRVQFQNNLFPNPTSNYFFIDFSAKESIKLDFLIYDLNGNLVVALLKDKAKAGLNRFSFDINELPDGLYFLRIQHENKIIQQQKLVVKH